MFKHIHRTVGPNVTVLPLVVGIVMTPVMWNLMAGRGLALETLSPTVALVTNALVLCAAAAVYILWRLAGIAGDDTWNRRLSGWLVMGLTVVAVPGFLLAFLQQGPPPGALREVDGWLLINQVLVAALLVMIARVCERFDVISDPAFLGVVGGLVLTAPAILGMVGGPAFRFGPDGTPLVGTALVLGGLVLAWNLLQRTHVSFWVRQRLAFSAVALVFAQSAGHLDGPTAAGAAVVANLLGALIICATALRLLRQMMREHQEQVVQLRSALVETEVAVHQQRDLLHELGSTLAGIASASEIIRQRPALPAPRRRRLERMLDAEVARLVRLMSDRVPSSGDAGIDLDEVLGTIVLSHQARGEDVRWRPSGLVVAGRADDLADDLAEVLNILLENAARHAAGAPVTVDVVASDGMVQLTCSDLGPGVPAEMRARLYESGSRGPDSPGQGLGLAIAKRLLAEQGGTLDLRPSAVGATFVVSMPEQVLEKGTVHAVAHAS